MKIFLLFAFISSSLFTNAQGVGIGTPAANASSILDVNSNSKGMLIPRLTTAQRKNIGNAATGLMVYDTDKNTIMFFDGVAWRALSFSDENKSEPQSRNSTAPATNAGFGSKVSISGDYAIIGAPRYGASGLTNMGVAYIFNRTGSGWKQSARLAAYDSAAADFFGGAVAISGDYAVVGSANKKVGANFAQGRAYIYHRNGTSWTLDTALVKPQAAGYEDFGWSVGVCAFNTGGVGVAIGAPYDDAGLTDNGSVYCYQKKGNSWALVQSLRPTDLGASDNYGFTIAMDTDYVAVAATGQDNSSYAYTDAGAVYIYAFGGGVWNYQQKLQGITARGQFGFAISLSSDRIAIGAPWATTYSNTSASVSIYQRTGSTWTNIYGIFIYNFEIVPNAGQLQPSGGATAISVANLTFGISLSLSGNTLLIGASAGADYPNGGNSYYSDRAGTTYIYKNFDGDIFTRTNIIQSEFPSIGDLFGQSVSMSNGRYVIGNSRAIVNGVLNAGNVYFGAE